jgi:dTDP-4-dehydrorhamnose 3,5-epimerase
MFERIATELPDVLLLKPKVFQDPRGFFAEVYRENEFADAGVTERFVQDNHSKSTRGTVRGLHYQFPRPQAKLCRVIRGVVLDVAVDVRRGSPTFGKCATALLSAENMHLIYIPIGFAHGFAVLSDEAEFLYKCSDYYDPPSERGVLWCDAALGISWNVDNPVLSEKDSRYPRLAEISPELLPKYER